MKHVIYCQQPCIYRTFNKRQDALTYAEHIVQDFPNALIRYTTRNEQLQDISELLPSSVIFGDGKDKYLVITCTHFTDKAQAQAFAQSQANNPSVLVRSVSIQEQML